MSKIFIGTSGWVYSDWQGVFYPDNLPQNKWLEFYSQHFATVEVNSTFYHQMRPGTFVNWSKMVPKDFIFTIKANRFITHIKRLLDCSEPLNRLLEQLKGLGNNLGPILFQLPPRWRADEKRLDRFLYELRTLNSKLMVVFEFRDESWFKKSVLEFLKKYNVGLVINDSPHFPKVEEITTDFTYIRFHGPSALYSSEYSEKELEIWAKKIKSWEKKRISVFAYFNNDVGGYAIKNARSLTKLVAKTNTNTI